jgi:hypothetical protein
VAAVIPTDREITKNMHIYNVIPESRAADSSGICFTAGTEQIPDLHRFAACPG